MGPMSTDGVLGRIPRYLLLRAQSNRYIGSLAMVRTELEDNRRQCSGRLSADGDQSSKTLFHTAFCMLHVHWKTRKTNINSPITGHEA